MGVAVPNVPCFLYHFIDSKILLNIVPKMAIVMFAYLPDVQSCQLCSLVPQATSQVGRYIYYSIQVYNKTFLSAVKGRVD